MSKPISSFATVKEAACRWQLPPDAVYSRAAAGVIPTVRLGRWVRIRWDVVERIEREGFPPIPRGVSRSRAKKVGT